MTRRDYHPRLQALLLAVVMLVVPCGSATAASGGWKGRAHRAALASARVPCGVGRPGLERRVDCRRGIPDRPGGVRALVGRAVDGILGSHHRLLGRRRRDLWAVGSSASATGPPRPLAEHWNGVRWSVVAVPSPASGGRLADVSARARDDVWAVGWSETASLIEHWNGRRWRIVPSPPLPQGARLDGVTKVPRSAAVWAVGVRPAEPDGAFATLTERWNGRRWRIVSSPSYANGASGPASGLTAVAAAGDGDVWAVGGGSTSAGDRLLVEHWDGDRWVRLPRQPATASAAGIARVPGTRTLWVVGSRASSAETTETFTERIRPGRWDVVASPSPDQRCEHSNQFLAVAASANGTVWAAGDHYHLASGCGDAVTGPLVARHRG